LVRTYSTQFARLALCETGNAREVQIHGHMLQVNARPENTLIRNGPARMTHSRSVSGKRSLTLREFAPGIEALERFVRREPLRRVHECVFGVLAMESEPVDPRL
jgi:hypothetical protein